MKRALIVMAAAACAVLAGCSDGDTAPTVTSKSPSSITSTTTTSTSAPSILDEPEPPVAPAENGFESGGEPEQAPAAPPAGLEEECAAGTAAPSTCEIYGYPFGTTAGQGKTIDHCGDSTMELGTTFYTDGTTGWTQTCEDQMRAAQ